MIEVLNPIIEWAIPLLAATVVVVLTYKGFVFANSFSNKSDKEITQKITAPDNKPRKEDSSIAINLNTDHVDYGGYEQILAVNVLNQSEHDLKEECLVKLEKMDRGSPNGIDLPIVLRTAGQIRGNRSGRFSLSRFEDKGVPVLFRNPRRKNEWYIFDEQGNKHLIYAHNTKMLIGIYGGENNKKHTISFNRSPIRGNFEYSPVLIESENSDFVIQKSNRMPLVELRDEAEKLGWIFPGGRLPKLPDFIHGLKQAGIGGTIRFYGRHKEHSDYLTHSNPLIEMDKGYWLKYELQPSILSTSNNFDIDTFSWSTEDDIYQDIHVDRDGAMYWLKNDAEQYRGRNERFEDVHG